MDFYVFRCYKIFIGYYVCKARLKCILLLIIYYVEVGSRLINKFYVCRDFSILYFNVTYVRLLFI